LSSFALWLISCFKPSFNCFSFRHFTRCSVPVLLKEIDVCVQNKWKISYFNFYKIFETVICGPMKKTKVIFDCPNDFIYGCAKNRSYHNTKLLALLVCLTLW
jgi:hypothetical protein